jgi:hypothetical protein
MIRNVFGFIATLLIATPAIRAFNLDDERWRTSPVTMHLQLGTISGSLIDGSTSWGAVAEDALATWNGVLTNFRFTVVRDSTVAQARSNRLNNVFFSATIYGSAFDSRTLAVTLLSTSSTNGVSNGYTEADVLFNTVFSWNSYRGNLRSASGGGTLQDFRRVAIHEFGHALGLDHPDAIGQSVSAIMNSVTSNTDTITPDDIAGARAIYDGNTVAVAPSITTQPTSRTVTVGASTTFTVVATGTAPLTYQWFRNGSTAIAGATAASLTLGNVQLSDAASYTVVVTNAAGSLTSTAAALTVNSVAVAPTITVQPTSLTVTAGASATFSVTANGTAPLIYQWRRNGTAVPGATAATFNIASTTNGDAAGYTVVITNAIGSVTSSAATLTVNAAPMAPTISTQPASQSVSAGAPVSFSVTATGTAPLAYQWRRNGTAISGATASNFTIPATTTADAANYTVVITNAAGSVTSATALLTVTPAISRIGGVSVRTTLAANQILIVGINVAGGAKPILIRAAGPALGALGVPGTMADPSLTVFSTATPPAQLAFSNNWAGDPAVIAANATTGAFPFNSTASLDAALVTNVDGGRTVQVSGPAAGNLIVEAYDAGTGTAQRLTGISARNRVGTGADLLIAGFTVSGPVEKRILIRGVGPTLATPPFNLTGVLADPKLELFTATTVPELIGTNDTYNASLAPVFASVGSFALAPGSRDAAFIVNLPPGGYTVQVSGADGGTGIAIVEIYELP